MHEIDRALEAYSCPYCKHTAKAPSGRTLHLKSCKGRAKDIKAQEKLKVGQKIRYQGVSTGIAELREGLAVLDNGQVAACTRLRSDTKDHQAPSITYPPPRTVAEWVDVYMRRHQQLDRAKLRWHLDKLFRLSGFVSYRKWSREDLAKILDKRLPKS